MSLKNRVTRLEKKMAPGRVIIIAHTQEEAAQKVTAFKKANRDNNGVIIIVAPKIEKYSG
jgi:hypothetical protein